MPKYNRNSGQPWTAAEITRLKELAAENTPTRVIGLKLGRTPAAGEAQSSLPERLAQRRCRTDWRRGRSRPVRRDSSYERDRRHACNS